MSDHDEYIHIHRDRYIREMQIKQVIQNGAVQHVLRVTDVQWTPGGAVVYVDPVTQGRGDSDD